MKKIKPMKKEIYLRIALLPNGSRAFYDEPFIYEKEIEFLNWILNEKWIFHFKSLNQ